MWQIISVVVTVLALVGTVIFYFKSAKQLGIAITVLGGWLEQKIKGQNVTFRRDKKGRIVGLSMVMVANETLGGSATAHDAPKKAE